MNTHGKSAIATVKAKPAVALIDTIKGINAEIERVRSVGKDLQHDMHVLACSVLAHVGKHGDTRPCTAMVDAFIAACPDMVRVNSLKQWFETFGRISFADHKACFVKSKAQRLGEAMEKPFWRFKALEGAPYQPLDIDSWLDKQVKALEKDKAAALKANPQADVQKQTKLIFALKTHNVQVAAVLPN